MSQTPMFINVGDSELRLKIMKSITKVVIFSLTPDDLEKLVNYSEGLCKK